MDEETLSYYSTHATEASDRYATSGAGIEAYLAAAFTPGMRILDVGCGSGRDMAYLLSQGCDVHGVDPCASMLSCAVDRCPELAGKLELGGLPTLSRAFEGQFDGVLCSAVLMHLRREDVFDAAFAIRSVLKDGGQLLLSVPLERTDLQDDYRDSWGRLFTPLNSDFLELLFERLGFQLTRKWASEDSLGREGFTWSTLLFTLRYQGTLRPLDQIESILNRDKKTATYKLALFRALGEIARTEHEQARWPREGIVAVPIRPVAERWVYYYWPLLESKRFIPQIRGESQDSGKTIAFRPLLTKLVKQYENAGGLARFVLDYRGRTLNADADKLVASVIKTIAETIVQGPVTHAGGSLETGPVFGYDSRRQEIIMDSGIWHELSLLGHWIGEAVILRWAELTEEISRKELRASAVIDLLLTIPIPERDVLDARNASARLGAAECTWTGARIGRKFYVDHVIPFSLWHNNDLWNLMPVLPSVNAKKRDRLPTRDLLQSRKECMVYYWEVLRSSHQARFDHEVCRIIGEDRLKPNWENLAFKVVAESIETTALQQACERWQP